MKGNELLKAENLQTEKKNIVDAITIVLYDDLNFDILPETTINGKTFKFFPDVLPVYIALLQNLNDKFTVAQTLSEYLRFVIGGKEEENEKSK